MINTRASIIDYRTIGLPALHYNQFAICRNGLIYAVSTVQFASCTIFSNHLTFALVNYKILAYQHHRYHISDRSGVSQ